MRTVFLALVIFSLAACSSAQVGTSVALSPSAEPLLLPSEQAALQLAGIERGKVRCSARNHWSDSLRGEAKTTVDAMLAAVEKAGSTLRDEAKATLRKDMVDKVFWRMVQTQIVDGELHNLGAVVVANRKLPDGTPLLLFRTAFTATPTEVNSCVQSLTSVGVRHLVNLYAGPMPTEGLEAAERLAMRAVGGSYFTARENPEAASFREDLRAGDAQEHDHAMLAVVQLIREQILDPNGYAPRGHIQVHCGGGMHRTGMVVGVLERCWNRTAMPEVAEHYKRHVGWRSEREPGGFEEKNLEFIANFDCELFYPGTKKDARDGDKGKPGSEKTKYFDFMDTMCL